MQDAHTKRWQDDTAVNAESLQMEKLHPVNPITGERYKDHTVVITDAQVGKKIGRHAQDYGLNPGNAQDRAWLISYVREILTNPDERAYGEWRYQPYPVVFHIKNGDVVIENANGEFVTLLKGGITNARVKNARE